MNPHSPLLDPATAYRDVLYWLDQRDIDRLQKPAPGEVEAAVTRFLRRAHLVGFALEILPVLNGPVPRWHAFWTRHAETFIGFAQAPESADFGEAQLLACASLLRNDWCRDRLERIATLPPFEEEMTASAVASSAA